MPFIDRITASSGGSISVGATPEALAAVGEQPQTVEVPRALRRLLDRAGIVPPPAGKVLEFDAVNSKLDAAKFDTAERMQVKVALSERGLLTPGRRIG